MEHNPALERRIEDLEVKASFSDDLLDRLNMTIYRQQEQIDRLILQMTQLRQQTPDSGSTGLVRDELPPHY